MPAAGVSVSNVDLGDLEAVRAAMVPGKTKMLMIESPTNPRMQVRRRAGPLALPGPQHSAPGAPSGPSGRAWGPARLPAAVPERHA